MDYPFVSGKEENNLALLFKIGTNHRGARLKLKKLERVLKICLQSPHVVLWGICNLQKHKTSKIFLQRLTSHKLELKRQGTESCMYTIFYENDLLPPSVFFNYILSILYVFEKGKLGQKQWKR